MLIYVQILSHSFLWLSKYILGRKGRDQGIFANQEWKKAILIF